MHVNKANTSVCTVMTITPNNMTGSGIWTVTMRNDWFSDSSANLISEFSGRFTGSVTPTGGVVVPIPSALGIGFFGLTGLVAARRLAALGHRVHHR